MEDEAVVVAAKRSDRLRHAGVVTPNMVSPIAGLVSASGTHGARHAGDRVGGVGEHHAADAVQPGDVGHRIHHGDIGDVDIGGDIAGGEGGDHSFGTPTGSARMPAVTIEVPPPPPIPMIAADIVARRHEAREGLAHRGDGRAAVAGPSTAARRPDGTRATSRAATSTANLRRADADIDDERLRRPPP